MEKLEAIFVGMVLLLVVLLLLMSGCAGINLVCSSAFDDDTKIEVEDCRIQLEIANVSSN